MRWRISDDGSTEPTFTGVVIEWRRIFFEAMTP
jgi:hypothetical protein